MIRGVVEDGTIHPLDPLPADWSDGRQVVIEATGKDASDDRAAIEQWYANLKALGPAKYEPGEREAIEKMMVDADREAKEAVRKSWTQFDDPLSTGHEPPGRGPQR